MLEAEYWSAWERSQQPQEKTLQERLSGLSEGEDSRLKAQKRSESRVGDVRFLDGLLNCVEARAKLLGLYSINNNVVTAGSATSGSGLSADAVQVNAPQAQ